MNKSILLKKLDNKSYSWIKESNLYKTLLEDNEEELLEIKICCIKTKKFNYFLETINYWDIYTIPIEFWNFLFCKNELSQNSQYLLDFYDRTNNDFFDFCYHVINLNETSDKINQFIKNLKEVDLNFLKNEKLIFDYHLRNVENNLKKKMLKIFLLCLVYDRIDFLNFFCKNVYKLDYGEEDSFENYCYFLEESLLVSIAIRNLKFTNCFVLKITKLKRICYGEKYVKMVFG